jgi:5-methylcytosine-specific restriction endonuclease McrA
MVTKHNARYANGHRRRQVRAAVLAEETHCAICGLPVDVTLPAGQAGSPEIDEAIPVSKGGSPYRRDNCRLTHRLCNARRGNGTRQRTIVAPFITARQW